MCLPGLSLAVSALFRWRCNTSIHLFPSRSVTAGVRLFHWLCLPGLSLLVSSLFCWPCSISIRLSASALLVSALFRWLCSISIHLSPRSVAAGVQHFYSSPRSVTGVVHPFPLAMQHFYSFVSQVCHCWCPPFSAGDATFLFVCLPGLSLVVSTLLRCFYSLPPMSATASVRPFPLAMQHFCSFVPRLVTGGVRPLFLFICLPGLSLLVSALVLWPCSISIHVSPRPVTGWWSPPFSAGHVAFLFFCLPDLSLVCPCLLAMKHFYSFVSQVRHCWSMWHLY